MKFVFGLGYVGAKATACLLNDGCSVVGVDVNPDKVAKIEAGQSPVSEPGLGELLAAGRGQASQRCHGCGRHLDDADIATSITNDGIRATPSDCLVIADDARAFANAVPSLLGDLARPSSLAEAARHHVLEYWTW